MISVLLTACAPPPDASTTSAATASAEAWSATPHDPLPAGFEGHWMRPIDRAGVASDTVRFAVIGDGGNANSGQFAVADALKEVCDRDGCAFVLYAGDNIYSSGCSSVDDPQFEEKFEIPYAEFDIPFYMSLGNHDYGAGGSGYEYWRGDVQVDYTEHSDLWTLPDNFYDFTAGPAHIYSLDSNSLVWGLVEDQYAWMTERQATNTSPWQIAFGHHPYLSNGPHGNAGEYDGYDLDPISSGAMFKEFIDTKICGTVQVYFSGHDHSLQWLEPTCGSSFVVSGAASSPTSIDNGETPTIFASDDLGFVWVEIVGDVMTLRFYDDTPTLLHEGTIERTL